MQTWPPCSGHRVHVIKLLQYRPTPPRAPAIDAPDRRISRRLISATLDFPISQTHRLRFVFSNPPHRLHPPFFYENIPSTKTFEHNERMGMEQSVHGCSWLFLVFSFLSFFFLFHSLTKRDGFVFYERGILYVGATLSSEVSLHSGRSEDRVQS